MDDQRTHTEVLYRHTMRVQMETYTTKDRVFQLFGEFGFYAMPKLMDLLHVLPEYPETSRAHRVLD